MSSQNSTKPLQVTLYTKEDCHLCHEVRAMLNRLQGDLPLIIKEVDIYSDQKLFLEYRLLIPVVSIKGGATLMAPITEDQLRQALSHAYGEP